jgi:hypothetical protein
MGVGDLVHRQNRLHPGRQLAGGSTGEQFAQSMAVGMRDYDGDVDPPLGGRLGARPHADEGPAVADQCEAALMQHRTIGDRVPTRLGVRGELDTEAADERLVLGAGQSGRLPPAVPRERGDVSADRASRPGHQQPVSVTRGVAKQVADLRRRQSVERNRRRRDQTVPVTVSYELTELGLSLQEVMRGIKDWAEAHMDEVLAIRDDYATRIA